MSIAYVNGRYVPRSKATVSIEDRGYQFADGVYEVIWIRNGVLIDEAGHMARLKRSLAALKISLPVTIATLKQIMREMILRNHAGLGHYTLYLQITRGVAQRNHVFPKAVQPSLIMTVSPVKLPTPLEITQGVKVILHPDLRWARKDIKSISLLPNVLARQKAFEAKAREAVLIDETRGVITEGSSTNIFIVKNKTLITHPADTHILNGVTRMSILALARKLKIKIAEHAFTPKELLAADEVFISSTTAGVLPVSQIEAKKKKVGEVSKRLYDAYQKYVSAQC